jgi:subtilase family serine protease
MVSLRLKIARTGGATALVASLLLMSPVAVAAGGAAFPSVGVHPHAVLATQDSNLHFSCQNRHLDDPSNKPACYSPQSIQAAYGFDKLLSHGITGKGRTIVIVDAFQSPTIAQDLASFDAAFGLPAPAAFNIIAPNGLTPFDATDPNQVGWSGEISLDVEWAHAIAPDATIDLVLATDNQDASLNSVTKYAVDHNLGDVISQSFGEAESCALPSDVQTLHKTYQKATNKGMTLVASSGDSGAAQPTCDGSAYALSASWPANDPLVTGVGATNLQADLTTGAYGSERAWADAFSGCFPTSQFGCSGGGFSNIYERPAYQTFTAGISRGHRGLPDVAFNGGVDGGVLTYWGVPFGPGNAFIFGGTSAGSPQWAGLVALADQLGHNRVGQINATLYGIARSPRLYSLAFHDITTGNNSFLNVDSTTITGYQTGSRWDPVTGLGTPKANVLVPFLALGGWSE